MKNIIHNSSIEDNNYLNNLNPEQFEAVNFFEGPILVLSGAGTGKTRVLTSRIANLISKGICHPSNIMAVTFTNKAAREMRERIFKIVGPSAEQVFMGTFHSIGARILRENYKLVGLKNNFSIFDLDDQIKVIKQILKEKNIDERQFPPKLILKFISNWKDRGVGPEDVAQEDVSNSYNINIKHIYNDYQDNLIRMNAADFGDLITYPIQILKKNNLILKQLKEKISFVLVDEYQDTNLAQYLFIRLMVGTSGNICCVGDDDQSIYSWRGAQVKNILNFQKDFSNAKVVRLEQNYRSSKQILSAANKLISNNKSRLGKDLWTDLENGDDIDFAKLYDSNEEAKFISDNIEKLSSNGVPLSEIAVLVRTVAQNRIIERRLNSIGIPNTVVGGPFLERLEIKDAIAYLRIIVNSNDDIAFQRIVNTPRRGVGSTTINKIIKLSRNLNISFYDSVLEILQSDSLSNSSKINLKKFIENLTNWKSQMNLKQPKKFLEMVLEESGYQDMWKIQDTEESKLRIDNLGELINYASEHDSINGFLENISLAINSDRESPSGVVSLMTLHAAKGLEFDVVFIAGFEDGLFPSSRSLDENGEQALEEERRLAYVGITRAKSKLFISFAENRPFRGFLMQSLPSRFLSEITDKFKSESFNYENFYENLSFAKNNNLRSLEFKTYVFDVGQRVFNIKFGMGDVIEIDNENIKVKFDHAGIKNVNCKFLTKK